MHNSNTIMSNNEMVQISIVSVELKMCHRFICIGISTQYAHNNWPL